MCKLLTNIISLLSLLTRAFIANITPSRVAADVNLHGNLNLFGNGHCNCEQPILGWRDVWKTTCIVDTAFSAQTNLSIYLVFLFNAHHVCLARARTHSIVHGLYGSRNFFGISYKATVWPLALWRMALWPYYACACQSHANELYTCTSSYMY